MRTSSHLAELLGTHSRAVTGRQWPSWGPGRGSTAQRGSGAPSHCTQQPKSMIGETETSVVTVPSSALVTTGQARQALGRTLQSHPRAYRAHRLPLACSLPSAWPPPATTKADRDGQLGGNNPMHCHLNARAMRCKILCFQNVLSAALLPSRLH